MFRCLIFFIFNILLLVGYLRADVIKYQILIEENIKQIDSKNVTYLTLNKGNPPVISAVMGDDLEITVVNKSLKDMIIHWHGVMIPNNMDGVIDLNIKPIKSGDTFVYKFKVKQYGTFWYHAHGFEEAMGVRGAMVFYANKKSKENDRSEILIFEGDLGKDVLGVFESLTNKNMVMNHGDMGQSDINNEDDNDNDSIDMNRGDMEQGGMKHSDMNQAEMKHSDMEQAEMKHSDMEQAEMKHSDMEKAEMKHSDMEKAEMKHSDMEQGGMKHSDMKQGGMKHFSDVEYVDLLVNNKNIEVLDKFEDGRVKLRIINAFIDGFLNFKYAGGDIEIVASDGIDVNPVKVSNLSVAMGETYDVVVRLKVGLAYELKAYLLGSSNNDYVSTFVGSGDKVYVEDDNMKKLSDNENKFDESDVVKNESVDEYKINKNENTVKDYYPYADIVSVVPDYLLHYKKNLKINTKLKFDLVGNHEKYDFMIVDSNGKKIDLMKVKKGDAIRITMQNKSMMPHPMHLHGFFFKVVEFNGKNTNFIKHTINLNHMDSVTIEFLADAEGKWLYHCHNLFHMANGMEMIFEVVKK